MRELHHPVTESIRLENVLHALSDPARMQIVLCLVEQGEVSCGRCTANAPKSTVSHHLRVLREAGVIRMRPEGVAMLNSVRSADIEYRFPGLLSTILDAARTDPAMRPEHAHL